MFDITFRPLKDTLFNPLCHYTPAGITPLHITILAFLAGIASCTAAAYGQIRTSLLLWAANRALDCLDGALARHRRQASDAGGFLDLLSDFVVYSAIPIAVALSRSSDVESRDTTWIAVSVLEATFHVNNFVLFYIGAVLEKQKAESVRADGRDDTTRRRSTKDVEVKVKELTSVAMRPALIEGLESGVIFTVMLAFPGFVREIAWGMAGLVCVGIVQRTVWVLPVL